MRTQICSNGRMDTMMRAMCIMCSGMPEMKHGQPFCCCNH